MKEKNRKAIEAVIDKIAELDKAISNASVAIEDESNEYINKTNEDSKIWDSLTNIWYTVNEVTDNLKRFIEKYK